MTLADALWFNSYWGHETVTTLQSHHPAPRPYVHAALFEGRGTWTIAGKLDRGKEAKEQWDKPRLAWGMGCTCTWSAGPGWLSALWLKHQACQEGRKQIDGFTKVSLVHVLLGYSNNGCVCTVYRSDDHTYVNHLGQGSGLCGNSIIVMWVVTICNYCITLYNLYYLWL